MTPPPRTPVPTIVSAVGSAAARPQAASVPIKKGNGNSIEKAMAQAVVDALARGITDPEEHRRLQLEARKKAKAEIKA